jgi:hypothetical protein
MPGAPYYAEGFSPLPGRCFRLIARPGEADPLLRASCLARFVAGAEYLTDSWADRSSSSDD